jgi:hypothetical protein
MLQFCASVNAILVTNFGSAVLRFPTLVSERTISGRRIGRNAVRLRAARRHVHAA